MAATEIKVTATPVGQSDGTIKRQFTDCVNATGRKYVFDVEQDYLEIVNRGGIKVTLTIGGESVELAVGKAVTVTTPIKELTAAVEEGYCEVRVTSLVYDNMVMTKKDMINLYEVVDVAADKTLGLKDAGTYQNVSAAASITVPTDDDVAFPIGTNIVFFKDTDGVVQFVADEGVTIKSASSYLKIGTQNTRAYLKKEAKNKWHLTGTLSA